MKKTLFLLLPLFAVATAFSPKPSAEGAIKWMTWEEAQQANKKKPKKIFVDVYTDWCGWCKRMDATTFSHAEVASYMNENYYCVKFNAEQREPIMFNGKEYAFVAQGTRGYNALAAMLLNNQMSYPTTVYLDEQLNVLTPVPGYQEPKGIEVIMNYFGSNAYKTVAWEEYQKTFKGKI